MKVIIIPEESSDMSEHHIYVSNSKIDGRVAYLDQHSGQSATADHLCIVVGIIEDYLRLILKREKEESK